MEAIGICGVDGRYTPTYYCLCSLGCSFYKIAIYLIQCPIPHYPAHHTKPSLLLITWQQERSSTTPNIWCTCLWSYKIKEWGTNCFMHQPQPGSWHKTHSVHMEFVVSTHSSVPILQIIPWKLPTRLQLLVPVTLHSNHLCSIWNHQRILCACNISFVCCRSIFQQGSDFHQSCHYSLLQDYIIDNGLL